MSHDQQAQRLREIDDLLAECQRHEMTGVRVSYAQLRAMRDSLAAPVQPAAVAEAPDDWRQQASRWLIAQAEEHEQTNRDCPLHVKAYPEWEEWPRRLRILASRALAATPAPADAAHPDDVAVDHFASAMKAKMAASRVKGRGGWENMDVCPPGMLQGMLVNHLSKGDPVDVGNFAMMLFNRGEKTTLQPADAALRDAAEELGALRKQEPVGVIADDTGRVDLYGYNPMATRKVGEELYAAPVPPAAVAAQNEWAYCPECGSEHSVPRGNRKQCENCGQEWFTDIDYSDVVRLHLSNRYSDKDAEIAKLKDRLAATPAPVAQTIQHGGSGFTQGCVKCEHERAAAQKKERQP